MRTPHSSVWQGKRVRVELKDGTAFIAKFKNKHGNTLQFFDHEDVRQGDLKIFAIYKALPHELTK